MFSMRGWRKPTHWTVVVLVVLVVLGTVGELAALAVLYASIGTAWTMPAMESPVSSPLRIASHGASSGT